MVPAFTSIVGCLPVYWRSGVGIWILVMCLVDAHASHRIQGIGNDRTWMRGEYSADLNPLIHQSLTDLFAAHQLKRIGRYCLALFHTGDHIRAPEPVGLGQVSRRPACRMIGMRVVETDDVHAAPSPLALNTNQLLGIDVVPILRRITTSVSATRHRSDFSRVTVHLAEQHTATFVRI